MILGYKAFLKISEIEGLILPPEKKQRLENLINSDLTNDEKRKEIKKWYELNSK